MGCGNFGARPRPPSRSSNSRASPWKAAPRSSAVGALLSVHLDAHEVLVQEPGGLVIFERLVLHHVAPVARRVPDGEEDRSVLGAGAGKGVRAPRVPVDGVVLVLEEVGARLLGEAV